MQNKRSSLQTSYAFRTYLPPSVCQQQSSFTSARECEPQTRCSSLSPFRMSSAQLFVGFDPEYLDKPMQREVDLRRRSDEYVCSYMPIAIYVKIDGCEHEFLSPAPCAVYHLIGHNKSCLTCTSAVQTGVFAVKPFSRNFQYYYDAA